MNAIKESRISETTASLESQLKEEIQQAVDKERLLSNKKQEVLKWELQSVRADLQRMDQQHSLREDVLRKEITDLQQVFIRYIYFCFIFDGFSVLIQSININSN
jgi:hypothetical protein